LAYSYCFLPIFGGVGFSHRWSNYVPDWDYTRHRDLVRMVRIRENEMNNADMPAMPMSEDDSITWLQGGSVLEGLSKREHFAGLAMQGFISAGGNGMPDQYELALLAVGYADALLAELDKPGE
jgi:hypothetical protein